MSDRTQISWTDATWSPVTGCTRVSEGCLNCYIERTVPFRVERRRFHLPVIGGTTGVRLHPDRLEQPLRWRKPRRIFVCSMADLFHEDVPDEYIAKVFAVAAATPRHTFQVLTKRHARMRSLLSSESFQRAVGIQILRDGESGWREEGRHAVPSQWPLPNVWLGVSVESQKWADWRIPSLLDTPAAVRWLSCEPLLGPVDLHAYTADLIDVDDPHFDAPDGAVVNGMERHGDQWQRRDRIDWVVAGGESGPGARPMHPDWARSLRDQCVAAGVPFHFKQAGAVLAKEWGATGKGGDPVEWPEEFPREYPHAHN